MLVIRGLLASVVLILGLLLASILPSEPSPERSPRSTDAPTSVPAAGDPLEEPSEYLLYLPRIQSTPPFVARNIVLLIGDGMGLEHVKAGGMYLYGAAGTLPFEQFPLHARLSTHSADNEVTDSAAAASAMATGRKVNNEVVSKALPGSGEDLLTLLEYAKQWGLATGLVTNTPITDATPASFGAHADSRDHEDEIAADYLHQTRPNVLFGGGHPAMTVGAAQEAGYTVVTNQAELLQLDTESQTYVSGQFGQSYIPYEMAGLNGLPHLSEMTSTALRILDNDPQGLFLVVEGGRIDTASHNQETSRIMGEMAEFARAAQVVIDWAKEHPDTMIVVLADHETGTLQSVQNSGAGQVPEITWTSSWHTSSDVGIWVTGGGLDALPQRMDNTQIFHLVTGHPLE